MEFQDLKEYIIKIGRNVRERREALGLDLDDLAHNAQVNHARLAAIENGSAEPRLSELARLAHALETGLDNLTQADPELFEKNKTGPERRPDKCRLAYPDDAGPDKWTCLREGDAGTFLYADKDTCKTCDRFKPRYIQYPITLQSLSLDKLDFIHASARGRPVAIRPMDDNENNKTYLGMHLGDLPWILTASYSRPGQRLDVETVHNPTIYIFETRQIVYGAASWWHFIESPDELESITDEKIQSQWYVQLAREFLESRKS